MPAKLARRASGAVVGARMEALTSLLLAARASLIELRAEPFLQVCEQELAAAGVSPRKRRDAGDIQDERSEP
jgi:hypothetical protein